MIKHAWDSYERYAWGYNELSATSKSGSDSQGMFGNAHLGASLVDALDTLYIAGFMSEYEKGKKWVEAHLDYNIVVRYFWRQRDEHFAFESEMSCTGVRMWRVSEVMYYCNSSSNDICYICMHACIVPFNWV